MAIAHSSRIPFPKHNHSLQRLLFLPVSRAFKVLGISGLVVANSLMVNNRVLLQVDSLNSAFLAAPAMPPASVKYKNCRVHSLRISRDGWLVG
jgi:hypothetical protein